VYVSSDGTLYIACGNKLSRVQADDKTNVQCGVEPVVSKEPVGQPEETVKQKYLKSKQKLIKDINNKSEKERQDKEKEDALFGVPHIVGLDVGCTKCVTVSSNKVLEVWDNTTLQRHATAMAPKRPTAVRVTKDERGLVVSDKSGDVYLYNIDLGVRKYLLGHVSMVLNLALSPCNGYIVTCDRDEKVRVSNFPNSYNIAQYCLGHTEYVSAACYLSETRLASISGDKSLKLWDTSTSHCVYTIADTAYTNLAYNGRYLYTTHSANANNADTVISCYELSDNALSKVNEVMFNAKIVSFSVNVTTCLILTSTAEVISVPINNSGYVIAEEQVVIEGLELKGLICDQITIKKTVPVDKQTNDYFDRKRRRIAEEGRAAAAKVVS